jgi:hypothetical protein
MSQSPSKKYLHFSKRIVHSTLVGRRRNNVSKRKYSYISIDFCHLIVISFFEIQNSTFCQEQVLIVFERMWAYVMCATCTVRAMHVPRVRYVPCMCYVYGTCHACAMCTVRAMHVPRVRYVPCMCHVYGTCHACATCTVRAMHVPRVRYLPCMCHVYGTCHACTTCTVSAMHVPGVVASASSLYRILETGLLPTYVPWSKPNQAVAILAADLCTVYQCLYFSFLFVIPPCFLIIKFFPSCCLAKGLNTHILLLLLLFLLYMLIVILGNFLLSHAMLRSDYNGTTSSWALAIDPCRDYMVETKISNFLLFCFNPRCEAAGTSSLLSIEMLCEILWDKKTSEFSAEENDNKCFLLKKLSMHVLQNTREEWIFHFFGNL